MDSNRPVMWLAVTGRDRAAALMLLPGLGNWAASGPLHLLLCLPGLRLSAHSGSYSKAASSESLLKYPLHHPHLLEHRLHHPRSDYRAPSLPTAHVLLVQWPLCPQEDMSPSQHQFSLFFPVLSLALQIAPGLQSLSTHICLVNTFLKLGNAKKHTLISSSNTFTWSLLCF